MKLLFTADFKPYKKGEKKNIKDKRTADYYLTLGVAVPDLPQSKSSGCADCDEKAKEKEEAFKDEIKILKTTLEASEKEVERLKALIPESK